MTTPIERYRAIAWAREFMAELSVLPDVSTGIRRQAVVILRHFPEASDLDHACFLMPHWIAAPTELHTD